MALTLAKSAAREGATVLNYFKAVALQKDSKGKLNALKVLDMESGKDFILRSNCIVNATGVFADSIPAAGLTSGGSSYNPTEPGYTPCV